MTSPLTPPVSLLRAPALRAPGAAPLAGLAKPGEPAENDGRPDPEAVRETAREFESLLLKQLVAAMRATTMDDEENPSGGQLVDHLIEEGLANHLARSGGIGLGDYLTRDLTPELADPPPSRHLPTAALLGRGLRGLADTESSEPPEHDGPAPARFAP
jgi:Rod binding domain-containing protein